MQFESSLDAVSWLQTMCTWLFTHLKQLIINVSHMVRAYIFLIKTADFMNHSWFHCHVSLFLYNNRGTVLLLDWCQSTWTDILLFVEISETMM